MDATYGPVAGYDMPFMAWRWAAPLAGHVAERCHQVAVAEARVYLQRERL